MKNFKWRTAECLFLNLVVASIYFGSGQVSAMLLISKSLSSPIWAPSGFMVVAVSIFGFKVLPGIFSGTFAINAWYFRKHSPASFFPVAVGVGLFALIESTSCAWLLKHPVGFRNGSLYWKDLLFSWWTKDAVVFQLMYIIEELLASIGVPIEDIEELIELTEDAMGRLEPKSGVFTVDAFHDALWLFAVAPATAFISGTGNALLLSLSNLVSWGHFAEVWPTWVLGDLAAILCYTPCLLHIWTFLLDLRIFYESRNKRLKAGLQVNQAQPFIVKAKQVYSSAAPYKQTSAADLQLSMPMGDCSHERFSTEDYVALNIMCLPGLMKICCCNHKLTSQANAVCTGGCAAENQTHNSIENPCNHGHKTHIDKCLAMPRTNFENDSNAIDLSDISVRKFLMWLAECVILFIILICLSLVIFFDFGVSGNQFIQHLSYLVFPVVIWASFRFNRVGLPLAVVVVTLIASAGTAKHHGPLYHSESKDRSLLQVQMFVSVLSMVATTLAAVVYERKQMEEELNQMNSTLEFQVQERTKELEKANIELQASQAAAEEASRAKSEFLANMSHEIRGEFSDNCL
ncbi:hypothetical protein L7F22_044651 [Adiantum nelumboides]|nr:hypothetical protein [Adiantum nelumboides]